MINIIYETGRDILTKADAYEAKADKALADIQAKSMDGCGWIDYAARITESELSDIEHTAARIRKQSDVLVVIGIGGSYLGAKAALDFCSHRIDEKAGIESGIDIEFAGFSLSASYHASLIKRIKDRDFSVCCISKSGGTLEPSLAFELMRNLLIEKYGEAEADRRTYAITDPENGKLKEEADEHGWTSLYIPQDIGGRYSVLTPVGLLPIAAAGLDIKEIIVGARESMGQTSLETAKRLACTRRAIQATGKVVEIIAAFEPAAASFTDWLLQLYGESEGKEGKGMLPDGVLFSRDLHSLGQFLQEGNQMFSETFVNILSPPADLAVRGRKMSDFNAAAMEGVAKAHRSIDIPIIQADIPDMNERSFGEAVQFFETACAITGLLMDVNPFNQPGVEAYKKEMMQALETC